MYTHKRGSTSLVWLSTWDDEAEARAFADGAAAFVARRFEGAEAGTRDGDTWGWSDGHLVERRGQDVLVLASVPEARKRAVAERVWAETVRSELSSIEAFAPDED